MGAKLTNEELVERIQKGDDGLYPDLWDAVRKFVAWRAKRYGDALSRHGCEEADLINAGYIARVDAAQRYNRFQGTKFITYLDFHLRRVFRATLGIYTSKVNMLDACDSLDADIDTDDGAMSKYDKARTLESLALDEMMLESVFNQELRAALDEALELLPYTDRRIIWLRYYFDLSVNDLAGSFGVDVQEIRNSINRSLSQIFSSKYRGKLSSFLYDDEFNPYSGTGMGNKYCQPEESSVAERFVLRNTALLVDA